MINSKYFKGKRVLITGGTGSFGRECTKQLLTHTECNKVIIFSRDEWKQWEMQQSTPLFSDKRVRYFLGDVRDAQRLQRAFNEVDIVIHAAALKQVPAAEYNPDEFVKTNVIGAMNIINAAIDQRVERVIALSTDKAVNPINLYGATKLCSDKVFIAGNAYVGAKGTPTFSIVRYGNVINSRGSVIPFWKSLIAEGAAELPITDKEMTRFWMTLEQSANFVLDRAADAQGGEIFIPKIPSMKITDLAEAIAPGMPQKVIGIREGEKLHETLISAENNRGVLETDDYYVITPQIYKHSIKGKPLPKGFCFRSDNNPNWISAAELSELV